MSGEAFLDTNVFLYLLSEDAAKARRAETVVSEGGTVSVQVLNEIVAVTMRKHSMTWPEIRDFLDVVRRVCRVVPVTLEIHERALDVAERYRLSIYDGLIVAAALASGCGRLLSEDMQDGQTIDGLTINNPFAAGGA